MKRSALLAITVLAGASSLSMSYNPSFNLLTSEDYHLMESDSARGPALSAILDGKTPYWESYNEWQCFPAKSVEIECVEAGDGDSTKIPILHVIYGAHYYEFSLDSEPEPDCGKITARWRDLLAGEDAFCAYAAFLEYFEEVPPDSDAKDGSTWIIKQLKTAKGRWTFDADENWIKDDLGWPDDDESEQ